MALLSAHLLVTLTKNGLRVWNKAAFILSQPHAAAPRTPGQATPLSVDGERLHHYVHAYHQASLELLEAQYREGQFVHQARWTSIAAERRDIADIDGEGNEVGDL
ncbi:hypothetical protein E8E12_006864 [Didymella heteroderae]|uniref:Uncharacterized protein n=1 Tax=Didymella heteroderae TaxID=1769908 RepID=A0A9P4WN88_9PLEO|nr:hypothetical protein E8E12_006864 [Didymella heteroderae]